MTTPVVVFKVYVPSPAIVSDVWVQLFGFCAGSMPHNLTDVARSGNDDEPGVSFVSGLIVWLVS